MLQSRLETLKNLELIKATQLFPNMESIQSFKYLEKLKLHKIGKCVVEFFEVLKSFSNLKKLDIKRITKRDDIFSDSDNSDNEETKGLAIEKVKAIQLFFLENIKQFEYIKFPLLKSINCFQIQKNYPNIRFRWYTELFRSDYEIHGIYEGSFEESDSELLFPNQFGGRGVYYYFQNGARYEGEFKNGSRNGKGIEMFNKSVFYDGEWKNDWRDGIGMEVRGNQRYEGEWKCNKKEGRGRAEAFNEVYEGEFKNDKFEGNGIYISSVGRYEGKFHKNKQEGFGTFYFYGDTGKKYEGDWKNDDMHGVGKMTENDGTVYYGSWRNGAKGGVGKQTYSDGSIYDGEWHNNVREGTGILTNSDGTIIYEGEWKSDEYMPSEIELT